MAGGDDEAEVAVLVEDVGGFLVDLTVGELEVDEGARGGATRCYWLAGCVLVPVLHPPR